MWTRALAALGIGVWCFFVLFASVAFVIDRGLALRGCGWPSWASGWGPPWSYAAGKPRQKEKEFLRALEERGELTPATAAMRTSLTVEEASKMLEKLAGKGHLRVLGRDGVLAYALFEKDGPKTLGPSPEASSSKEESLPVEENCDHA